MSATATAPTLYALSEDLTAQLDSIELTEPGTPERLECETAIARYFEQLPAKVDSVSWMLAHLESQVHMAADEIKRLQARKQSFERAAERLEGYCVAVLEQLPEPRKGARKLEGATCTLSLRPSERAIATDEAAIPADYKTAVVEMPARAWEVVVSLHPQILGVLTKQDLKVRLIDVKKAIKAGEAVPGADIAFGYTLVRK